MALLFFEATRELLFNSVKQAKTANATIRVKFDNDPILLAVTDEGAGFNPSDLDNGTGSSSGFGLFSIRERLDLLNDTIEVESAPGKGSCFTIKAPVITQSKASKQAGR